MAAPPIGRSAVTGEVGASIGLVPVTAEADSTAAIHNRAIMDRLTVIGVDRAQGFAIGEPVPLIRRHPPALAPPRSV